MEYSKTDFLTVINSILLLIDYQPLLLKGVESGDRWKIKNAAIISAKAASLLNVPVVLTSADPESKGEFLKELKDLFPLQSVIIRKPSSDDALEDTNVISTLRNSGREKLIVSGLWTSKSFATSAIHCIREGFDVYGLIDAGGDKTPTEHNTGVQKMLTAGVTPITWMALTAEWMNEWSDTSDEYLTNESHGKYSAMLSYLTKPQELIYHK